MPQHPQWVALESQWTSVPTAATTFVVDALVKDWRAVFRDTTSNPTLAWEYWNGGWWRLGITQDATHELKNSGEVQFNVPTDLKATDWAGKQFESAASAARPGAEQVCKQVGSWLNSARSRIGW